MNYFDTAAGQNTMENISRQLTRIADSLEALAAAGRLTRDELCEITGENPEQEA